jgi:hypothetical protein
LTINNIVAWVPFKSLEAILIIFEKLFGVVSCQITVFGPCNNENLAIFVRYSLGEHLDDAIMLTHHQTVKFIVSETL